MNCTIVRRRKGGLFSLDFLKSQFGFSAERHSKAGEYSSVDSLLMTLLDWATDYVEESLEKTLLLTKRRVVHNNISFELPFDPVAAIEFIGYGPKKNSKHGYHECWEGDKIKEVAYRSRDTFKISLPQKYRNPRKDVEVHVVYWAGNTPVGFDMEAFLSPYGDGGGCDDQWQSLGDKQWRFASFPRFGDFLHFVSEKHREYLQKEFSKEKFETFLNSASAEDVEKLFEKIMNYSRDDLIKSLKKDPQEGVFSRGMEEDFEGLEGERLLQKNRAIPDFIQENSEKLGRYPMLAPGESCLQYIPGVYRHSVYHVLDYFVNERNTPKDLSAYLFGLRKSDPKRRIRIC